MTDERVYFFGGSYECVFFMDFAKVCSKGTQ